MVKNASHTLAYSIIGLQEMNLAFKYPIVYWNCGCLISDSGGRIEDDDEDDYPVGSCADEEDNEEEEEEKDKKKRKINYGKIATAIGQMQSNGITVSPPDINKSSYTFVPDAENNKILYGIKGITKVGDDIVDNIIKNRPYRSLPEFLSKVKVNKTQMVMLIKSGAFDSFGKREGIMRWYIDQIADKKKTLNLRNMQMLLKYNLLPQELDWSIKVFRFTDFIRKHKVDEFYELDDYCFKFYEQHYDVDEIVYKDNKYYIPKKYWDKVYSKEMDPVRNYIKNNLDTLLEQLNKELYKEPYKKYALGSLSKWEMDSISFYYHEHELSPLNKEVYNVVNFFDLPEQPEVDRVIPMKGKQVPLFKLNRIAGTVLDKDKNKNMVTILTPEGVVKVKVYRAQFTKYDKQISERKPDGTKKVIERSWFSRGNKIMVVGIRRDDNFIPKLYKSSPYESPFLLIDEVNDDGTVKGKEHRIEVA